MNSPSSAAQNRAEPTFAELFTPKLVSVLREGYGWSDLRADALAGLTVAIVALPLSMAIAIGAGAGPERGLYGAIVGGFLISLLGGSRFQIGGPAAAKVVRAGIHPVKIPAAGSARETLARLQETLRLPPPWLAKVMGVKAHSLEKFAVMA